MAENYVLLETIELTQAAASVVFDNIPQTGYTDLKVVISGRTDFNGPWSNCSIAINGSTANFSQRFLFGSGSAAVSVSRTDNLNFGFANGATSTSNTYSNEEFYFPNYTSNQNKSFSVDKVAETNAAEAYIHLNAGLWSNTAAITSIAFTPQNGNYVAGSTFSLYGVAAVGTTPAVAPKATGGNIVANDGTYWYHAFLTSGTFTPQTALTCDALVVAGGGGGGTRAGGGGGAGGLLAFTSQSLTPINYTVTIGAGGAGAAASPNNASGSVGSDSQFAALTLVKGGGGGGGATVDGASGGSGGGGGNSSANGGSATPSGQGNPGAAGSGSRGGGGGGAGASGATGSASGNGGAGVSTYSSWAAATSTGVSGFYAGGGAGGASFGGVSGTGGSGGGGNGGPTDNSGQGFAGITGTGGGGGGGTSRNDGFNTPGGAGGSGIVIIRYAMA